MNITRTSSKWSRVRWGIVLCLSALLLLLGARRWLLSRELLSAQITHGAVRQVSLDLYRLPPGSDTPRPMKIGVDADNWSGQVKNPAFEQSLKAMRIDFISWHVQPGEETKEHLLEIVDFCRKHHWSYLFNTEWGNYNRGDTHLVHSDGTVRYDLAETTLQLLKDDPLFLGVIYDEAELMQAMNGVTDPAGKPIAPYLVDTRTMTPNAAFDAVSGKVRDLQKRYANYGKRLIFEMVFPDYPFAFARGGALLAPKLLKESNDDLMYAVYRGAALEYHSEELWACADLWFLNRFPEAGKRDKGFHTPEELLETLQFANAAGFDYVYVEQAKALMDTSYALTDYGRAIIRFQELRSSTPRGDWRQIPVSHYVRRFPDGYWGQKYSPFIPDHPYGSWSPNPYRDADARWFVLLSKLSHGAIPSDADTWNASKLPYYAKEDYFRSAGLPLLVVYDHYASLPKDRAVTVDDFCQSATCGEKSGK